MIVAGANVQQQNAALYTPLHLAVQAFDLDAVDALLRAGADVDRQQADGWTATSWRMDTRNCICPTNRK